MYDIRQFRPALYALILLGMTGFALASQSPGVWVLAVAGVLLNAWLVRTGRFWPMPRMVANIVTMLGLLVLAAIVRGGVTTPILVIGQFLVLLQLVKLFEQRANRDYAQLLVLSLLLMVAAAISTASLVFGILFITYLFLSLYCCLLFHLKVETDHARQAIGVPEERLNPATLRQDQRYLSRSMRRLTGLVSTFAVTTAILTFLFFPRGTGAGLLGPLQWKPKDTMTGFSDSVNFRDIARITQNTQIVAYVKVSRGGVPMRGTGPLLLRGVTLDRYSGDGTELSSSPYQWTRTPREPDELDLRGGEWRQFPNIPPGDGVLQQIQLEPTGTNVLFAIGGISAFKPDEPGGRYRYWREDEVLQTGDPILQTVRYEVISRDMLTADPGNRLTDMLETLQRRPRQVGRRASSARPTIDPKIGEFARLPEVSGTDANGPLALRRDAGTPVSALDATIARNIESYLRSQFSYTLDLTDARRIDGQDPMVAFLYDLKRGHCEYFAGAMTLMCQSLGMQARMVVGFKCDDYNAIGGYWVVRQSHAHAWVEVLTTEGTWQTFDPTSGREAASQRRDTMWQQVRALFNFLEYTWANSVVAYDRDSRSNLIASVDNTLSNTAAQTTETITRTRQWFTRNPYVLSSKVLSGVIGLMVCSIFVAVVWFLLEKWKLRRRARRIGIDALPTPERTKLARQLGFYDDLLRLLERYRVHRPSHLTPLEFSDSLTYLPADAFDAIRRLTEIFYRVRYGRAELTPAQRRHLTNVISGVGASLGRR